MKKKSIARSTFIVKRFILKTILVYSFGILFLAFGIPLVENLFTTGNQAANSWTYYGFAIFAALANVIFSYARTFNNNEQNETIYLRGIGMRFLYASVYFLIGSVINYVIININKFYPTYRGTGIAHYIIYTTQIIAAILIVSAFAFAAWAVNYLMNHLFEKLFLNKDNYLEKKEN
jgi:hypothetical protein